MAPLVELRVGDAGALGPPAVGRVRGGRTRPARPTSSAAPAAGGAGTGTTGTSAIS